MNLRELVTWCATGDQAAFPSRGERLRGPGPDQGYLPIN